MVDSLQEAMRVYTKADARIAEMLAEIVGSEFVLTREEDMEPYSHDEMPGWRYMPEVVVKPGSAVQVARIVQLAAEENVPVTPRGLGTGLSGGALPVFGGIVVSLERMNGLLEIDEDNLMAVVEPGLVVGELHKQVEARGLFYPPDPASLDSCSIGGNIAENAGGPRAVKYGITRDYVMGIEAVLPDGSVVTYGGKTVKNVTGYDLANVLIGSEGTLGIITRAILKLIPLPQHRIDLLIPFHSFNDATRTVTDIIRAKRIVPVVLEFMDRESVKACEKHLEKELPFSDAEAQLIVGLDGNRREDIDAQVEIVAEICLDHGADDVLVAESSFQKDQLWHARRILLETLKAVSERVEVEDVVVPRVKIPELISTIKDISTTSGIPVVNWGHAGDGNVHVGVLKQNVTDEKWNAELDRVNEAIFAAALSLGGMITGEHGIGLFKKRFMPKAVDEPTMAAMRTLKRAFDPAGILNPGKVLP
ncbi:MAG: FAD-linked oxidase C-terminal domain-containing protein [Bacillota bacterium]